MAELLHAFDKNGRLVKTAERKQLLSELREESYRQGDVSLAVEAIYLMLSNSREEVYVVQRGDKPENPFLMDKTAGGHVAAGESYATTLRREAKEEIGADVLIADLMDFHDLARSTDTSTVAVVRPIDYCPWLPSTRAVRDGRPWLKRHKVAIYAGAYDGPVKFVDGEAIGLRLVARRDLLAEIRKEPDRFTDDIKMLASSYSAFF